MARYCNKCGKDISHKGNRASKCDECYKIWREYKTNLGTRDIGSKRQKDFKKEFKTIRNELKELGLRD